MAPKESTVELSTTSINSLPTEITVFDKKRGGIVQWVQKRLSKKNANKASTAVVVKPDDEQATPKEAPVPEPKPAKRQSVKTSFCKKKSLPEIYQGREWSIHTPIPYTQMDAEDVSFKKVDDVMTSWAKVKGIPNYLRVAGELLMKKMFELDPAFRTKFGFDVNCDWNDPAVCQNPRFIMHGIALVAAFDKAVDFLGPDLEPLELEVADLGRRHVAMGALPEHFPLVGEALFYTLEQALGEEEFNDKLKKSWTKVYHFLAYHLIMGLLSELSERQNAV